MTDYRDLLAWQKAIQLTKEVFRLTERFPREELYGLAAQLRRASISIPSNIAEGSRRFGRAEKRHFMSIALGSAAEVETQLVLARELSLAPVEMIRDAETTLAIVLRLVNGLSGAFR